jgi:hypothetical protein
LASRRIRRTKSIAGYLDSLNQEGLESRLRNNTQSVAADSITSSALSEEVQVVDKAIQSINYAPGADGWRIDGGGNAEFGNVFVRGDINAETGTIGYWNISRPVVERTFGDRTYNGTFLESSDVGPTDEDTATKSYVALFKSYFDDPTNFTSFQLESNKVTLTLTGHSFFVGDPIVVQFDEATYDALESTEVSVVYVSETTPNTISYLIPVDEITEVAYNEGGAADIALTEAAGTVQIYFKDVSGLYLRDYSKALFDYGYFSNEGVKYVSAETYNLVHNPSFEYNISNVATYSNTGWTLGANLTLSSFDNASVVTIDAIDYELFKDDSVYTSYSGKLTWGTVQTTSYASVSVDYELFQNLSDLNKTLYFDFYAYFNPAGASISATQIDRTSGSANVVVTAASHGLSVGEYIWNEFDYLVGASQGVDAYVPLKIVAANTNTFTVTVAANASSTTTITPLVRDRLYRYHPVAYKLTDIRFELPNANTISLYEVLAADTKASWDANAAYSQFSIPYAKDSTGGYALKSHDIDDSSNFVVYSLPRLGPISAADGTLVPYEIKIDASKFSNLYSVRDASSFASGSNFKLQFPGWIYRNEATPATKVAPYATTGIYLDNISISTEKSFFYGGGDVSSQSWRVDASKPDSASVLSAKTWINIDLETQNSYLNHTDFVSFKSPLLTDKLVKNSGIYSINDVDNIDYRVINIGTSLVSDYSSLIFTSGEYEYKLPDDTYANYESLVASRVEKDKAFLYLSTLYKNLDADGTYSVSDPNKWEASIAMASGSDQNTEISITGKLVSIQAPVTGDDTYLTVTGDQNVSGNISTGLDITAGNDLYVTNVAYIGDQILSVDETTNFAIRKYTNTVTDLPTGTWYTIAYNPGGDSGVSIGRATAQFVLVDRRAGKHQSVHFMASATFGDPALTILHSSAFSVNAPFEAIRLKTGGTYDGAALQVYSNGSSNVVTAQAFMYANDQTVGAWELVDFIDDAEDPSTYGTTAMSDYANLTAKSELNLELGGGLAENKLMVDGSLVAANSANSAIYTIIQPSSSTFFGNVSIGNNLTVTGNLTVNGTTTTINSTTLSVDDKNIVLGNNASSTNTTADGGGITVEAITGGDKTWTWENSTGAWTSNQDINVASGKVYEINGTTVLSSSQVLGYSISDANGASTIVARNINGDFSGRQIDAANNISIGLTNGTGSTPYIDFNSGTTAVDYDARIITSGGSGTTGQGNVTIYGGTVSVFGGLAAAPTFTIRGATSQTGYLQVWENSGGTDQAYMDKDGNLTANAIVANLAIGNVTGLGANVSTFLITPTSANFANAITGETGTGNVVFDTSALLVTPNVSGSLKFTGGSSNSVTFTVTGSTSNQGNLVIDSGTTSIFGTLAAAPTFTVRGATSQTGNLQEWDNVGGTPLAYMDKDGKLTANAVTANLATSSGYPVANVANLGTNVATFLTTPSSANLRNAVTDEAGTGSLVFRGSTTASTTDIATGWYTIAYNVNSRASAKFIVTDTRSGIHQVVVFQASNLFHVDTAAGITVLQQSAFSLASAPIQKIRIKNGTASGDGAVLQIFIDATSNSLAAYMYENDIPNGWVLPTNWVADASDPGVGVYANLTAVVETNLDSGGAGRNQMLVTGDMYAGVNATSHVLASQAYSLAANAAYTLATNNTNQSLFPAVANGVAVESGFRYEIEGTFVVSHTVTTITNGTVTDVLSTSFNTPSLTYGWMEYGYATSTTATFAAGTTDTIAEDVVTTTLTNDAIANSISRSTTGTTNSYIYIRFRGVVKTSAAGNILPRIKFNYTDAGGVGTNSGAIQAGSWMRVTKVAETTTGWT